jgi:hypothetical protein
MTWKKFSTCADHRDGLTKLKPKVWATIVPTRTTKPTVALHTSLAHAKNAVMASSPFEPRSYPGYDRAKGGYPVGEAEVYELVDGEWTLRYEVPEGTYPNDLPWR